MQEEHNDQDGYQLMKNLLFFSHSLCPTLRPWGFPGKNIGVGCHFFLQGIFPTQGLNSRLLLGRRFFTTEQNSLYNVLRVLGRQWYISSVLDTLKSG